jgi:hypothetical protein
VNLRTVFNSICPRAGALVLTRYWIFVAHRERVFLTLFGHFGFLVALFFCFIGWLVGSLYRNALGGSIVFQYLYLVLLNDVLVAFTDSTARFLVGLPWVFGVAYVVFFLVSAKKLRRSNGFGATQSISRQTKA